MQLVTPDLQLLYKYLEEDFNPLLLCTRVVPILERLMEDKLFSQYVEPLKAIVLVRLIKQVSLKGLVQRGSVMRKVQQEGCVIGMVQEGCVIGMAFDFKMCCTDVDTIL